MASPKTPNKTTVPGGPAASGSFPAPSTQEAYFFLSILKHQKNKPEVDWDEVAAESGFKNPETAKVRFGQIKRKLGFPTPAGAKVTPRKRAGADAGTPRSSEKKRKTSAAKKKTTDSQAGGNGEALVDMKPVKEENEGGGGGAAANTGYGTPQNPYKAQNPYTGGGAPFANAAAATVSDDTDADSLVGNGNGYNFNFQGF